MPMKNQQKFISVNEAFDDLLKKSPNPFFQEHINRQQKVLNVLSAAGVKVLNISDIELENTKNSDRVSKEIRETFPDGEYLSAVVTISIPLFPAPEENSGTPQERLLAVLTAPSVPLASRNQQEGI